MSQVAFYERLVMSQNYDKSNLKLDFDNNKGVNSRKRKFLGVPSAHLLQSPDLKLLTLGSPELERLIVQNDGFIPTPTPGGSSLLQNGETPDDGKDSFARGFIEALQKLQEQDAPTTLQSLIECRSDNLTSKHTVITQQPRWQQTDQNRNTVPVITPTRFENRTFDNRTPPLSRQPTTIPLVNNFPTVSAGAVSTMGMTAMPRSQSSISYVTRPEQNMLTHQSSQSSNSLISSGMTLPTPIMASSILPDVQVKSEVDEAIVPHSESEMNNLDMNPIDLEVQEHIKHQRKKLRNRLAAQRCRKRKIEREDTLKIKVKELKSKNAELTSLASTLRMQVCDLKQQVMHHVNEGCQVFLKDSEEEKNLMMNKSS